MGIPPESVGLCRGRIPWYVVKRVEFPHLLELLLVCLDGAHLHWYTFLWGLVTFSLSLLGVTLFTFFTCVLFSA